MKPTNPMTPRAIVCPNCGAQIGDVCMTYVEPDCASDLAMRVPLYCADRIDAAFTCLVAHIRRERSSRDE